MILTKENDRINLSGNTNRLNESSNVSNLNLSNDGFSKGLIPSDISGCIKYLRFDEFSGATTCLEEVTGSRLFLIGSPLPQLQPGLFGNAIGFPGGSGGGIGSVVLGSMFPTGLGVSGNFSISVWFNPGHHQHSDVGNIFMFRDFERLSYHNNGSYSWSLNIMSGGLAVDKNSAQFKSPEGQWTHTVIIKESTDTVTGSFWVWANGSMAFSRGDAWFLNPSFGERIQIGAFLGFASFQHLSYSGLVDNISIYNRMLTSGEVQQLFMGFIPASDSIKIEGGDKWMYLK